MKFSRQITLSVALSLLFPVSALAADAGSGIPPVDYSPPVSISQNLPPIQGTGYNTPNYNNTGYSNYGGTPTYTQQPNYAPQYTQQNQVQQGYPAQAPLQGYVATAPAGTVVSASLGSPISSQFARVGDHFTATLGAPVVSGSSVVLPAGSQVDGQVMRVKAASYGARNGELEIRFTSATTPNGQRIPLSARIQTEDGTGIIKGGTVANRLGKAALNTGIGAGLGAALGTAMGPLSGGHVGRGAVYGTAVGAGLGAVSSVARKGTDATITSGQPINIVLDQPLTAVPSAPADNYNQPQAPANYYNNGQNNYAPNTQQQNPQPYNFYGGQ